MRLFIDIGNSRTKFAVEQDGFGEVIMVSNHSEAIAQDISRILDGFDEPDRVIVSNVAGDRIAGLVSSMVVKKWTVNPDYLKTGAACCGVQNGYARIDQLGIDRWAAIIAAWNRYKADVLVVDCGSAVTVDLVKADGEHLGGYIIPGEHMMARALIRDTGGIVSTLQEDGTRAPGKSTEECIANGTLGAVISFIENKYNFMNSSDGGNYRCIISGGGAGNVMAGLSIKYEYVPLLVFEGMKLISDVCP